LVNATFFSISQNLQLDWVKGTWLERIVVTTLQPAFHFLVRAIAEINWKIVNLNCVKEKLKRVIE
jgi:hypothetical protein